MTVAARVLGAPPDDAEERVARLTRAVSALFQHEHPAVIGAVLADCTAMMIAGYQTDDGFHEEILQLHVETVREYLPINIDLLRRSQPEH